MKIQLKTLMNGLLLAGSMATAMQGVAGETTRVSVASDGTQRFGHSEQCPSISADGRYVSFASSVPGFVSNDTNGVIDIFVHDRELMETSRVSIASDGTQANNESRFSVLSADGRFVAFYSLANNLVANDTNNSIDIFVYDRQLEETSRVSIASDGTQSNFASLSPSISADGRFVAFHSAAPNLVLDDTNNTNDVFVHDRQTGETTRISIASNGDQGNNYSSSPAISEDGRFVAFSSSATDLVAGDTNNSSDVFVHDRQTGEITRISVVSDGTQGNSRSVDPSISADGRFVSFSSHASNLVPGDNNNHSDVFVHDRQLSETKLISIASNGTKGIFTSQRASISADGRFVAFSSYDKNLVTGDTNNRGDVFVHDRQTSETTRVSKSSDGTQGNGVSTDTPAISIDGQFIAFSSYASNLVSDDTNNKSDIFVHNRLDSTSPPPAITPAKLELTATINGNDTLPKPGPALPNSGSPANWQYTITNSGGETASLVRLYGKQIEPVRDSKWTLLCALGEITGSNTASCSSSSLITDGPAKILLSSQGRDKNGDKVIIGMPAWYVGGVRSSAPSLFLDVLLNGADADNAFPGAYLTAGDTVTYTYNVTNTGPFTLTNVRVFDRNRLPVKENWERACVFSIILPAESVSCTRTIIVGTGAIARYVTAQSIYQSRHVAYDATSFYTGQ